MSTVDYKQGPASLLSYLLPRCWHRLHRRLQFRLTAAWLWKTVCASYIGGARGEGEAKNTQSYFPYHHRRQSHSPGIDCHSKRRFQLPSQAIGFFFFFFILICHRRRRLRRCRLLCKEEEEERKGGKEGDMYVVVSISERVGGSWWNQSSCASSGKDVVGCLFSSKPVVIIHRTPRAAAAAK